LKKLLTKSQSMLSIILENHDSRGFKTKSREECLMKKSLMFVAVCAFAVVMTGCMATHTNDAASAAKVCVSKKFDADIVAGKKAVAGTATVHNLFGIFTWGVSNFADDAFVSTDNAFQLTVSPLTVAKQGATYNACKAAKADMLLAAKYNIKVSDFFVYKSVKCDVTGYPGVVKGVK